MLDTIEGFLLWNPLLALLPFVAGAALWILARYLASGPGLGFIWGMVVLLVGGACSTYIGWTSLCAHIGVTSFPNENARLLDLVALALFVTGIWAGSRLQCRRPEFRQTA